jgi:threonine synthase
VRRLLAKFEGSNPTGTVKDRSSATAVAAALQFEFAATSVVSSGNAGSSIGAYSARAGLRSLVFAYEKTSAPKLLHMAATATDLVLYQGVYDDLIGIWDRLVEDRVFFDCGASRNAFKHEGKKTIAYEIAEQLGWRAPDVLVAPVAVGETFIAAYRGFTEMARAGWIAKRPMMVAAQAARANAVARAWRERRAISPIKIGYTVAEGLAAGDPGKKGAWTLALLRESGGVAGEAEDEEILEAQRVLARAEGIWVGPTGVATLAVLRRLLGQKAIDPDATICMIFSETGLKTEAATPDRTATAFDEGSLRQLVRDRLGAPSRA